MNNIPSTELLHELLDYSNKKSLEIKVQRVYHKAIIHRKLALAKRIEDKYKYLLPKSDLAMAMPLALSFSKELTLI